MCARDKRPAYGMSQGDGFREFLKSLEKRYRPPALKTTNRLLGCAFELQDELAEQKLAQLKEEVGDRNHAQQEDMWSTSNCKESYVCRSFSFIDVVDTEDGEPAMVLQNMPLDFEC